MMGITSLHSWSKQWIDANVWDGEDRCGAVNDWVRYSPDDLQELIDDLLDDLLTKVNNND